MQGGQADILKAVQLIDDIHSHGMKDAALIASAIGPCSGTKDWNDSRNVAISHMNSSILEAIASKPKIT